MRFLYVLLSFIIYFTAMSGCASYNQIEPQANPYANKIHFNNDIPIQIKEFNIRKNVNDLLEFELSITGTHHQSRKTVIYKIDWLDQDGFVLPSTQSDYKRVSIEPNRIFKLKQTATNGQAVDFKIYLEYIIN